MLSFLFEQYGYYPKVLEEGTFFVDGWEFRLIKVDGDKNYVETIEQYIEVLREKFDGEGPYLIRTRLGENLSYHDGVKYCLLCVRKREITINHLNKFHVLFKNNENKVELKKLMFSWQDRMYRIEHNSISNLRVDNSFYGSNLEKIMFCIGSCQNAVQYLSDIIQDYGNDLEDISLTHKRMNCLSSFDFFNPFNFVLDHPVRDLVELYRNDLISFEKLKEMLNYYGLNAKLASLFVARLLYCVNVLDIVEEDSKIRDKCFKFDYNIEKEISKIKKTYLYFKEKYNIRPIVWLEL